MKNQKRYFVDCRLYPGNPQCTLTISGTEDEILEPAAHHAVICHGRKDDPELTRMIRSGMQEEKSSRAA